MDMTNRPVRCGVAVALATVLAAGCMKHYRSAPVVVAPAVAAPGGCGSCGSAGTAFASPRYSPPMHIAPLPPVGVPPGTIAQPPHGMGTAPLAPGQPLPPSGPPAVTEYRNLPPAPPGKLMPPQGHAAPAPGVGNNGSARLLPPEGTSPLPKAGDSAAAGYSEPLEFPTDIPQFAVVYDKVATGLQPFPEGFTWLAKNGYRTVLHVRAEGEDDSAARTAVERGGMKYQTLDVAPTKLTKDTVAEFSRLVRDAGGHPLFVYDRKGPLAGALWYLHFRLTEQLPESQARARATRLGLKDDASGEEVELWLAVQKLLAGS
jgi:protein tyrosine phosphatase (PTP) superfamily phosphohydrolase (DUF442 family)